LIDAQAQDRIKSALGAALFHALLGYAFVTSLGIDMSEVVDDRLKIFDVPNMPVPPPIKEAVPLKEPTKKPSPKLKPAPKDPEGAAAPPNIKSRPTEIVAPKPEIRLPVPPPVIAAPIAGPGAAATSGNAPFKGPGTGAGGIGTGTGSGRWGNGGGGGGGGPARIARHAEIISDSITQAHYPRSALRDGFQGAVQMEFQVDADGRVTGCRVVETSGHRGMDQETCNVARNRVRIRPARDIYGRRVPDKAYMLQEWFLIRQEPTIPDDGWE
jgi:protein TonB